MKNTLLGAAVALALFCGSSQAAIVHPGEYTITGVISSPQTFSFSVWGYPAFTMSYTPDNPNSGQTISSGATITTDLGSGHSSYTFNNVSTHGTGPIIGQFTVDDSHRNFIITTASVLNSFISLPCDVDIAFSGFTYTALATPLPGALSLFASVLGIAGIFRLKRRVA